MTATQQTAPLSAEINGSDVLLIFQSPGLDEWASRKPISSENPRSAAQKINSAMRKLNKDRSDFDITNAVQCYPGKSNLSNRDNIPVTMAIQKCSENLRNDVHSKDYRRILVFGNIAKKSISQFNLGIDKHIEYFKHPSAYGVSIEYLINALR
jgi:uracil-DNA glycosylase family 4